jgi:hypothetical protein
MRRGWLFRGAILGFASELVWARALALAFFFTGGVGSP